jgi:hypothetical protein
MIELVARIRSHFHLVHYKTSNKIETCIFLIMPMVECIFLIRSHFFKTSNKITFFFNKLRFLNSVSRNLESAWNRSSVSSWSEVRSEKQVDFLSAENVESVGRWCVVGLLPQGDLDHVVLLHQVVEKNSVVMLSGSAKFT